MSRSSRQRKQQQYAVSLFPFLAVLVCTLGVLIVMLVMAVQAADVKSQQRHDEVARQQQQKLKFAEERRELADFQSASILSVRSDLTTRLQQAKGDRSYLEQQIKDTNRQAEDLLTSISNLSAVMQTNSTDDSRSQSQAVIDGDVRRLKSQITAAQESLKHLREDQSFETQREYAIVPFTGSGGTHRQPIFVECMRAGLVLQPYGIHLDRADFTLPLTIGNMLDSALLTVREYWERHGLADNDSKPYPLLVVRPDGAESYGLARRAMKSWDDEFGYELVDSETKLRFGQPDLQLKSEIESAIATAKRRQLRVARRRLLSQDDRWKSALQLARGLSPSASGGFEFAATGQPAHELLTEGERERGNEGGPRSRSSELSSRASFNMPQSDSEFRNQFGDQQSSTPNHSSPDQLASSMSERKPNSGDQNGNSSAGSSASSLANSRGSNWALPAHTSGARAYVRPIRLICEAEKVSVVSQNRITATIPLHSQTVASVDPLVSEVWKTIEAWGLAGRQAYWKPELRFSVAPGAERRFQELRALLDDSGLLLEMANER